MLDRLGNELKIGDMVVAYSSMRTGSSTTRMVQYEGRVVRFTPKCVVVECLDCGYFKYIGDEFKPSSDNIFKMKEVESHD